MLNRWCEVTPPHDPSSMSSTRQGAAEGATPPAGSSVLDFGRYAGWSLGDLSRHDPDYLRWLARHSAGFRYRDEIHKLLPEDAAMHRRAKAMR